jgi:FkbM family methyltransferase
MFRRTFGPSSWISAFGPFAKSRREGVSAGVQADENARLRQRILKQQGTIARLQAAVDAAEAGSRDAHRRLEQRRHSSLSHQVLRDLLPIRALRPVVSNDAEAAAARERSHLARSAEYRAAVDDPAPSFVHKTEVDRLSWWVPFGAESPERIARAAHQGFPYRAILQTREVAIGGFMIDIGANIGRTSIPRVLLGDVRGVYAAEPEPANYACLVRNTLEHQLRGFVLPDRVAIGSRRDQGRMRRSRYPGGHRLLQGEEPATDTIAVEVWPLDAWIAHVGVDADAVTFVKVDTQGCEREVLLGASSLLARRHVAWLIEIDPALLQRAGADVRDIVALVRPHFSRFIDTGSPDAGRRVRPIAQLAESLEYLGTRQTKTDLLLFHSA